jgi:ribulose-phosphate 3-epimerase
MAEIAPSILSADFARLADQVEALREAGARMIHVDVMDGHFVPNITLGPPVVQSLRKATNLLLDCHLMIEEPDRYAPDFIAAGAQMVSVHQEASRHLHRSVALIREHGASPGVVINPATPVSTLDEILEFVDFILVMSVNPGFGGQKFIPSAVGKIRRLDQARRDRRLNFRIEIDGGISESNVGEVVAAGCDIVVAGSSVFGSGDPQGAFQRMSHAIEQAGLLKV